MKKIFTYIILAVLMVTLMSGCTDNTSAELDVADDSNVADEADTADDSDSETVIDATPFGEWADVTRSSNPCKARIAEVVKDNDRIQAHIDLYNTKVDENHMITPLTGVHEEFTEYIVIEYEVLFPGEFPTVSYGNQGIAHPHLTLNAKTNDGGSFIASDGTQFIGLGMGTELIKITDDVFPLPGDTFRGAVLFQMIKDYDDFHLDYMHKPADSEDYIHALFAIK